jgi:hypothetical protein
VVSDIDKEGRIRTVGKRETMKAVPNEWNPVAPKKVGLE